MKQFHFNNQNGFPITLDFLSDFQESAEAQLVYPDKHLWKDGILTGLEIKMRTLPYVSSGKIKIKDTEVSVPDTILPSSFSGEYIFIAISYDPQRENAYIGNITRSNFLPKENRILLAEFVNGVWEDRRTVDLAEELSVVEGFALGTRNVPYVTSGRAILHGEIVELDEKEFADISDSDNIYLTLNRKIPPFSSRSLHDQNATPITIFGQLEKGQSTPNTPFIRLGYNEDSVWINTRSYTAFSELVTLPLTNPNRNGHGFISKENKLKLDDMPYGNVGDSFLPTELHTKAIRIPNPSADFLKEHLLSSSENGHLDTLLGIKETGTYMLSDGERNKLDAIPNPFEDDRFLSVEDQTKLNAILALFDNSRGDRLIDVENQNLLNALPTIYPKDVGTYLVYNKEKNVYSNDTRITDAQIHHYIDTYLDIWNIQF